MATCRPGAVAHAARVLLLSYLAAACAVSSHYSATGLADPGMPPIPHARVHLVDGSTTPDLDEVVVVADTVIGWRPRTGTRVAIPVKAVSSVEARTADPVRTVGVIGLAVVGTAVVLGLILSYIIHHSRID